MKATLGEKQIARMDFIGIGLSITCAIHCLAAPLLMGVLPLIGLEFLAREGFESAMIAAIAVVAGFAFLNGYRIHGRTSPFVLGFAGLAVFMLIRPAVGENLEPLATVVGGSAFVTGHIMNWRFARPCRRVARESV